ncbi:exodeoxyribonuclease VII large subunit [Aquimarina pacifica]|uniref:exodeoxyribonuclease VII large subunit n=1 Tax=Aquimarina pacifica TaxID=1296415 RepID=UPI000471B66D|nr:exodeoxyribonuclease VII large subunit [Aquimarina pacifica]
MAITKHLPDTIQTNIPELLVLFRDSLISNLNGHTFTFNGIYESVSSQAYHNNMFYYDRVIDKDTRKHITLFLHKKFKKHLKNREPYEFTGKLQLHREIRSGSIDILLYVSNIDVSKDEKQFITESEYNLVKTRYDKGFFDVEGDISNKLYNNVNPVILVLTGKTAKIQGDYQQALHHPEYYQIETVKTNFSNKNQFFKTLENIDSSYDYLAIVRGGGSGLGFFDQEDVCKKVLETNIPFITAIGHESDKTMLEKAADKAYTTPTAFGNALEQLVQKDMSYKSHMIALENEITQKGKEFTTKLKEVHTDNEKRLAQEHKSFEEKMNAFKLRKRKEQNIFISVILGLLLLLIIFYFIK